MCKPCDAQEQQPAVPERRHFLRLAGLGASAAMLTSLLPAGAALAGPAPQVPKPQNQLDPDQALERLMAGNTRYIQGVAKRHDFLSEREALAGGQNPYAAVLGCADSRIAPEYAFDTGRGDLFAVRIAGNFVTTDGLASLEYAVAVLGTPLVMVLGHESCGAVAAGVKAVKDGARFPGQIQSLADAIRPAVEKVIKAPGDLLNNAIEQNVRETVHNLTARSAVLSEAVSQGKLKIVGGLYTLQSGQVQLLS
ncbi:Carbonic anhydrase 2 [compost metagenome]|uniref:carbonic anhydrase n=1 Tax=Pseudomonas TaxID=286 RepID=UPI0003F61CBF|nr:MULTISPECIES: carbonic anhydrase [Pseudomonas]MCW2270632.1 carbonic anhydrase [Pseudomonas sp. JUb96]PRA59525.1 carbonic anhydrase [Pseudomonas sp. MYb187]